MEAMSMSSILLVVLGLPLVGLVSLWGWYQWSHRRVLALARKLPICLPALPLLGHLHLASFTWEKNSKNIKTFISYPMNCTYCFWIGPIPYIALQRPDDLKTVMNSSKALDKSPDYNLLKFVFGNGLITAPAYMWKKSRRVLNPVLQPQNLQHLEPVFNERANQLITELSQLVGRGEVDITDQLNTIILKNVLSLLFGLENRIDSRGFKLAHEIIEEVTYIITIRVLLLWLRWDPLFSFLYKETLKKIDEVWDIVAEGSVNEQLQNISKHEEERVNAENNPLLSKVKSGEHVTLSDAFSVLLKTDPEMFGDAYMKGEGLTIVGGGIDSVKGMMTASLLALASHPHVQDRLYQEVEAVVGTSTSYIYIEDIDQMTYLDQVIKETMRFFNVVPFTLRKLSDDIEISDCVLPAGCTVVLNTTGLHMNPRHYPNPEQFDPDRFSPENVAAREKFSYLPFSGGIRDCIGKHYAMTSMKITLAHLVREFSFSTTLDINNLQYHYGISLTITDGCIVSLQKRH